MRLFSRVLIFFYLLSTHFSLAHIHHDHHEHLDCKTCHLAQNIDSADIEIEISQDFSAETNYLLSIYHDTYTFTTTLKGYYSHAPPSFC